jgi:hypothetical protein
MKKYLIQDVRTKLPDNITDVVKNIIEAHHIDTDYNGNIKLMDGQFNIIFYGNSKNVNVIDLTDKL